MNLTLNKKWDIIEGGSDVITAIENCITSNGLVVPWDDNYPHPNGLDYHFNRSGGKIISPLLMAFPNDVLSETDRNSIATIIIKRYYKTWVKEFDTLNQNYNMLENFNGIETETFSTTETQKTKTDETGNAYQRAYQKTESDEYTDSTATESKARQDHNITVKISDNENVNSQYEHNKNYVSDEINGDRMANQYSGDTLHERHTKADGITDIYGFNTTEVNGVPSERTESNSYADNSTIHRADDIEHSKTKNLRDESAEKNGVTRETTSITDNTSVRGDSHENGDTAITEAKTVDGRTTDFGSTATNQRGVSDTEHHNITQRDLHRHGNLGVTTSQQMIESERQLWFWDYCEFVYECIDNVLTSPYFA